MKFFMAICTFLFVFELHAQTKILFIGDSLTEGYGVAKKNSYPSLIQEKFKQEKLNVEVVNGSISGSTTASALRRYDWFKKTKPDIIVLALGGNDGLRGVKPKESEKNLEELIIKIKNDGRKVLLLGMQAPPNYGKQFTNAFKKIYPNLARKHKIPLVPFLLLGVAGEKEFNQADGIHPNEKGHKAMSDTVMKELRKLL